MKKISTWLSSLQHEKWVQAVAFSPDGRAVLTAGGDKAARLWDVPLTALDEPERLRLSVEVRTMLFFEPCLLQFRRLLIAYFRVAEVKLFDQIVNVLTPFSVQSRGYNPAGFFSCCDLPTCCIPHFVAWFFLA